MKKQSLKIIFLLSVLLPQITEAFVPSTYDNDNLFSSEHDEPVSLEFDEKGGFFGTTKNGFRYRQEIVENDLNIKLQKFTIDLAYFYMSDKGLIEADSDLAAISIYLSKV